MHPREDDRNEEKDESPVPDPTAKTADGEITRSPEAGAMRAGASTGVSDGTP